VEMEGILRDAAIGRSGFIRYAFIDEQHNAERRNEKKG
jgi:hypothetical protein